MFNQIKIKKILHNLRFIYDFEKEKTIQDMKIYYLCEIIQKRVNKKNKDSKINIVFVCHRPQIWGSLQSVCEECLKDNAFNVKIVAIPNKKELPNLYLSHEIYESEGAEEYFGNKYDCVINGYDYNNKTWIDLFSLNPDYIFFQTPYNICRPMQYNSDVVSSYSKLCYVHYGMPFMGSDIAEESFPVDFLKNVYFHFAESKLMNDYYNLRMNGSKTLSNYKVVLTGYPKLDKQYINDNINNANISWKYDNKHKKFRIIWTPRWNTEEGNCTFFDYMDDIIKLAERNENIELLFRPHPQAFLELISKKKMTSQEINAYKKRFDACQNASIDKTKDYLPNFYSADLLISDESSIIPEFYLTGKPIIITSKNNHFNEFADRLAEGFYFADNWRSILDIIEMLMLGKDPLKMKRSEIINSEFYLPTYGSGKMIKDIIKKDFYDLAITKE